jgi:putative salt-induced outer membrane protein
MIKKIALSSVLATSLLVAAEADLKKDDLLVTHTELGYVQTTGNTDTKTFNLDSKIKKGWGSHIFTFIFDGQYAEDSGIESKNKFFVELEYDYEFTDRFAFDYLTGYKRDKFSKFDYQFYTGPGAKYKAIMTDVHNLSVEGNVLYSLDQQMDDKFDSAGNQLDYPYNTAIDPSRTISYDSEDYASLRVKGVYEWKITDTIKFGEEASYRVDVSKTQNYFIYSKTDLTAKISDIFSAGISYKVDYVNEPGDKEKTDTTFTVGLIIDY